MFLRKPDAAPTEGIRSYRATALTPVMSMWYASCILLRLENEKEPEKWKKLHIGELDGISCQHLQVMMTNVIQKHWEWQGRKESCDETRNGNKTNTVLGKLGFQDGLR